ncbi:MAG: hypothetical protein HY649_08760 [Acidobacteria bacterium]|nr:hypothetical protein [Acidobacteriota bacterium]
MRIPSFSRGDLWHSSRASQMGLIVCLVVGFLSISCRRESAQTELDYPPPRYPRYLVNPNMEELTRAARIAVRQVSGNTPLGKVQSGETVYVFLTWGQDMRIWEAIKQAWAERGVEAHAVGYWEVLGKTKEEYDQHSAANAAYGNEAWKELGNFRIEYKEFFSEELQKEFGDPVTSENIRKYHFPGYLDKHPEIQRLYAGTGGGTFWQRAFGEKHRDKFMGNWIFLRPIDLLSKAAEFPADVWNLVDEKTLRPIPFVSEVTFQDPEGTNLRWTLSPEQSQEWSRSSGISNHIYIYPSPLRSSMQEGGVLVAHANHTGVYPTMTVRLDRNGAAQSIEGGGRTGELFRMLVDHPTFRDARFPKAQAPGYWFFRQDGFATNPKALRSLPAMVEGEPMMANLSERNRAGIQHLAFSYDSTAPEDLVYAKERGIPLGEGQHTAHMHVYFPTVKWKLRDTGEWITASEKGYVKMFDDPEVRALASRYGDPDLIFRYEWMPSIPGINVAGDYQKDFASDPWDWVMAEWKRIQDGTYQYFVEDYTLENKQVDDNSGRPKGT